MAEAVTRHSAVAASIAIVTDHDVPLGTSRSISEAEEAPREPFENDPEPAGSPLEAPIIAFNDDRLVTMPTHVCSRFL